MTNTLAYKIIMSWKLYCHDGITSTEQMRMINRDTETKFQLSVKWNDFKNLFIHSWIYHPELFPPHLISYYSCRVDKKPISIICTNIFIFFYNSLSKLFLK